MSKLYLLRTKSLKIIVRSESVEKARLIYRQYYPNTNYSIQKLKLTDLSKKSEPPIMVLPDIQYL